jgi:hypothetical protein
MSSNTPKTLDAVLLKQVFVHNLNRIYFGKCYLDKTSNTLSGLLHLWHYNKPYRSFGMMSKSR